MGVLERLAESNRPISGRSSAPLRTKPGWLRLGGAIVLTVAAFFLSTGAHLPQQGYTFLLLYPAVIASAYFAGRDAGLAATATGVWLVGVRLAMTWDRSDLLLVQVASLILFAVIGAGSAILLSRLNRALRSLEMTNAQLVEATESARQATEETDLLLRELRHRVRNDLTNIVAILQMQSKGLPDESAKHLHSAADRLQVLAKVHERLSRQGHQPVVEMKSFLEDLCSDLQSTLLPLKPVSLRTEIHAINMPSARAVCIGLIVNELLTNAIKYAYPDDSQGQILVYLECAHGRAVLGVEDDGVGIAEEVRVGSSGLGHRLVRSLTAQLHGRFECSCDPPGTSCVVTFPVEASSGTS